MATVLVVVMCMMLLTLLLPIKVAMAVAMLLVADILLGADANDGGSDQKSEEY